MISEDRPTERTTPPADSARPQLESPSPADSTRPPREPMSPFMEWLVDHSGWVLFGMLLTAALLEGAAVYDAKRSICGGSSGSCSAPSTAGTQPSR